MKLLLTVYQRHYTSQGWTYSHLFGTVTITRRNIFSPWRVESCTGFSYQKGEVFDWCRVKMDSEFFINKSDYQFKVVPEVIEK